MGEIVKKYISISRERQGSIHSTVLLVLLLAGLVACAGGVIAVSGCAAGTEAVKQGGPESESDAAYKAYKGAMATFKRGNYIEALTEFNVVMTRYPYSQWAVESALKVGDIHFEMDKYGDAITAYRSFVKLHPNNPRISYAAFMVGKSYYEQLPGNWPLVPPAHEKDQSAAREALVELQAFVDRFPQAEERAEADQMIAKCVERLSEHEMYVANFYLKRKKPDAALGRLNELISTYPDTENGKEAMLMAAAIYAEKGEHQSAAGHYREFIKRYPEDDRIQSISHKLQAAENKVISPQ